MIIAIICYGLVGIISIIALGLSMLGFAALVYVLGWICAGLAAIGFIGVVAHAVTQS